MTPEELAAIRDRVRYNNQPGDAACDRHALLKYVDVLLTEPLEEMSIERRDVLVAQTMRFLLARGYVISTPEGDELSYER